MMIVVRSIFSRGFYFASSKSGKKVNQQRFKKEEHTENDVFKAYRSQVEQTSVLRQFRQQVFRRSQLNKQWQQSQKMKNQLYEKMQELLKGGNKQDTLNNVTKIESRLTSGRNIFHQNDSKSLLSDYGDYTSYNKVYPKLEDRNLGEGEFLHHDHLTENLYKFVEKLPDNYTQKKQMQKYVQKLPLKYKQMTISQYGQLLQKRINQTKDKVLKDDEDKRLNHINKMIREPLENENDSHEVITPHPFTGTIKSVDPWNKQRNYNATLSPNAVDTIYELYLQGWTIREISKRFGILPARAKFCVWVRAQLYHQIIPKMGVQFYLRGLRYQRTYYDKMVFCDYGLDLEELGNEGVVSQITEWNRQMLDAQRKEDNYEKSLKVLEQKKQFNKYQMIEVRTIGKQHAKYRLKEWVIFRGKGSDEYFLKNKAFRNLSKAQKKFNKVYY